MSGKIIFILAFLLLLLFPWRRNKWRRQYRRVAKTSNRSIYTYSITLSKSFPKKNKTTSARALVWIIQMLEIQTLHCLLIYRNLIGNKICTGIFFILWFTSTKQNMNSSTLCLVANIMPVEYELEYLLTG